MPEIYSWPTLAGVVVLTPDGFGFSYCGTEAELAKLGRDLAAGVPLTQAVGFSGSSCGFVSLVRVESKENSPTVYVVGRDFLGKAKEDFTFQNQADRDAFFRTLLKLLGPGWHVRRAARGGVGNLIGPIFVFLFGFLGLLCGGFLLLVPPKTPADPKAATSPPPDDVLWILLGINILVVLAGIAWFVVARKMGKAVWETVGKT
jgi:hypothetical protein